MRSSDHYLHGVISSDSLCGDGKKTCMEDVVKAMAEKIELVSEFKPAQLRDLEKELLRIDEVETYIPWSPLSPTVHIKVLAVCKRKQGRFVVVQAPQDWLSLGSVWHVLWECK